MNETEVILLLVAALAVGILSAYGLGARSRRREAREVAEALVPEIRAVLASLEAKPAEIPHYVQRRQRLPQVLPEDTLFAVETFYQCNEAFLRASGAMAEAFSAGSGLPLGDRDRAKELRDRCLKDVCYTGEAAVERLARLLR